MGHSDLQFKIKSLCTMAYRIDPKKHIAFTGQGHCKGLTQVPKLLPVTTFYKRDLLCCTRALISIEVKGWLWNKQLLQERLSITSQFFFFLSKFEGLHIPKTKNITCNFMSVGEKRNKVRRQKWNLFTPSELECRFRGGKISSETKHTGAGITFFLF